MTAASLISELTSSQSHKIRGVSEIAIIMEVLGRRLSRTGVLHLLEEKTASQKEWSTLCGRKIPTELTLPAEKFDGGDICCSVCIMMQQRQLNLKVPLKL